MDILSGSYATDGTEPMAGHFQVLYGTPDGGFKKAVPLKGSDGEILEIELAEKFTKKEPEMWRICTRPTAVDWDSDGDLDLVVGNFYGSFILIKGEGKGVFSPKAEVIMSGSKVLKIMGHHSDPVVVDWDNDGDLDILSGSADGGVQWAENTAGKMKPPMFASFTELIPALDDEGMAHAYSGWKDGKSKLGHSTRIWVSDVNGDGKLDITLGDTISEKEPAKGLTLGEAKAKHKIWMEKHGDLMKKMENMPKLNDEETEKLMKEMEVVQAEEMKITNGLGSSTGHVWLFLQK